MKRKIVVLLAAVAVSLGLGLLLPGAAKANINAYDIYDKISGSTSFLTKCDHTDGDTGTAGYHTVAIYYLDHSITNSGGWGCDYFTVGFGARIKYQSISGTIYWTRCGEDEIDNPFYDPGNRQGYEHIGNGVTLLAVNRYPNGVASTCTG